MEGFPSGISVQNHITTIGQTVTAAAGANAGTSPPAPVRTAGINDTRGNITFGSGSGPAAGAQLVVTFNQAYADTNYVVEITAGNAATAAILAGGFYITKTTGAFTLNTVNALTASQTNTVYSIDFAIIG